MRRLTSGVATTAVAAGAFMVAGPFAAAPAHAATTPTPFAMTAQAYGTKIKGGDLPAGSDRTAHDIIACENRAGVTSHNHVAEQDLGDAGTASGVRTDLRTVKRKGKVASIAKHRVAKVELGDSAAGKLLLEGVTSTSTAFHNKSGYHGKTNTKVGSISLVPPAGEPQTFPVPAPGETLTVPGVAEITLGKSSKKEGGQMARAQATSLVVELIPTDTKVTIAHSSAKIAGNLTKGLFRGNAFATKARGLDGATRSGKNPLQVMPCVGTHGNVKRERLAKLRLSEDVVAGGLNAAGMGDQDRRRTHGWEKGSVANLKVGGDDGLKVKAIKGKVIASRSDAGLKRSARATIGTIVADGETYTFPKSDTIEIPGVAKLERKVVSRPNKNTIRVTALRVTLLDGSGAVINLGNAKIGIKDSGR